MLAVFLMLPSLVLECRIHYLDLSVVRPGGYGNLARKASARAQRIPAFHYGQAAWALFGKKGCHNAYRWVTVIPFAKWSHVGVFVFVRLRCIPNEAQYDEVACG